MGCGRLEDSDMLDNPYLGAGLYGPDHRTFSGDSLVSLLEMYDECLELVKLNEAEALAGDDVITRKRRGKPWTGIRKAFAGKTCRFGGGTVSTRERERIDAAFLFRSVPWADPLMHATTFGGTWWDALPDLYSLDYREVLLKVLARELLETDILLGFIQLFTVKCTSALDPPLGFGGHCASIYMAHPSVPPPTPLVGELAERRADGEFGKFPYPCDGRPYNLFWGNLLETKLVEDTGLGDFLRDEIKLNPAAMADGIPAKACIGQLFGRYTFFCLSGDINDCLKPNKTYQRRYKMIVRFLLDNDLIYRN